MIRNRLLRDILMLGVSVTFKSGILKIIQLSAGFKPKTNIQKSSIDRQEMIIIIKNPERKEEDGRVKRFDSESILIIESLKIRYCSLFKGWGSRTSQRR